MHIKKLILEGFKSYGTRTELLDFDPEFNAITGLNGTGKSNILDSICFVLGISNLQHVRASNLQDLIYKNGQSGVTKASVTVVFDNSDKSRCPLHLGEFSDITITRQIVVGGKNRYLLNGSSVSNKSVIDFFSSIQLNVNNPHFLIMQGRITKVLNMKPPEILSMIEEAAGTRMYENKKHDAQKTIVKKDGKLREINDMVTDQINPKMEKMKVERNQYVEFQKIQREYDQLYRLNIAWLFVQTEKTHKTLLADLEKATNEHKKYKEGLVAKEEQLVTLEKEIREIQGIRDKECGGELQKLETLLKEAEKVEAKATAVVKSAKENISLETKHIKQLEKNVADDEKALELKKGELDKAQATFDQLKEAEKQDAEELAAAQRKFQAVSSGLLESTDGENATLQDQLMAAKQKATEAETEMKKCALKMQQDKKDLEMKKPLLKKTEMAFASDRKELEAKENELKGLKEKLKNCNYEDGKLESIQEQCRRINQDYRKCSDIVNNFLHRNPRLNFQYSDPEPNFDHSKVRGLLCKLFTIKDEQFARALESAAGGKLYNVVVDSDIVSAKLIEKGQLLRRTTFAPLNKIQGYTMDAGIIRKAQREYGADNVFLAQSLVQYNPEYENIMSWTFGQTLICPNIDVAEEVCNKYHKKTITLDGDVFDPQGVISGGSVEKSQPVLLALLELQKAESAHSAKQKELASLNDQIRTLTPIAASYETMKERERELEMIRARLEQTPHFQLQAELKALQEAIDANEAKIQECRLDVKEQSAKAKELENKMKNLHSIREAEEAAAKLKLKEAKKKAEDSRNKWKLREKEFETLNLEIQELEKSVQNGKEQILKAQQTITQLENDLAEKKQNLSELQENVKAKKADVEAKKDEIGKKNAEIQEKNNARENVIKLINEGKLDTMREAHLITNLKNDIDEAASALVELKKKHKWIETDQEYFGQPSGRYDFNSVNMDEVKEKLKKIQTLKEEVGKNITSKPIDMLGSQEERFHEVMNKKTIIEEDRSKILSVIKELDVKKEEVIHQAWDKVNHDFNSILSSLLPGAQAKLKPVEGKDVLQGLEVKVGFGGIWKDSLDELSGGQRSLVALSLILAMLLFKPAPLYILDEVDAALDPSHTQNIGQMLKAHFKQSQVK